MRSVTIYIDVLFLLNFLINSCLFYTTAKICGRNISPLRLCAVSALSALYAAAMFFPHIGILYTLAFKIIFSAVFAVLAFGLKKPREILSVTAVFLLVSFAFGGAAVALMFLTDAGERLDAAVWSGGFYMNVGIRPLFAAIVLAYCGITVFARLCRKNYSRDRLSARLEVGVLGAELELKGFIDTGCYLCGAEGTPAIAVEYEAVREALPPLFEEFAINPLRAFSENPSFAAEHKITVLPYRGFGGGSGVIPAIYADFVRFEGGKRAMDKILVGFSSDSLSDGKYNAIINPDIFSDDVVERVARFSKK